MVNILHMTASRWHLTRDAGVPDRSLQRTFGPNSYLSIAALNNKRQKVHTISSWSSLSFFWADELSGYIKRLN